MSGYKKKIAYLDYLENGMKIKNAGFARAEENNGQVRLEMRVKNIPETFIGQYELQADNGGMVGKISLNRGCGSCCIVWQRGKSIPEGKKEVQANSVYIRLPGRRLLQAVWPEPLSFLVDKKEEDAENGQNVTRIVDFTSAAEKKEGAWEKERMSSPEQETEPAAPVAGEENSEADVQSVPEAETKQAADILKESEQETAAGSVTAADMDNNSFTAREERDWEEEGAGPQIYTFRPEAEGGGSPVKTAPMWEKEYQLKRDREAEPAAYSAGSLTQNKAGAAENRQSGREDVFYGDKWEQLCHMYPVIHPFNDEREYLSIAPKDFIVLRQEYQKMVHNSFMLHGYYNYKHLILGRLMEKEEWAYYMGVPGNFYGREKMVAEMFGFEAFEGERTPAQPGDFGYFMKQVEL